MKTILSCLAAALVLSCSSLARADDAPKAAVVKGARDCSKTSHPARCEAIKVAKEACKDKKDAEFTRCVREKMQAGEAAPTR